MLNSLLAGGEVPGLWSPDDLAKELLPLEAQLGTDAAYQVRMPPSARPARARWRPAHGSQHVADLRRRGVGAATGAWAVRSRPGWR
jgi:hypothetical protein